MQVVEVSPLIVVGSWELVKYSKKPSVELSVPTTFLLLPKAGGRALQFSRIDCPCHLFGSSIVLQESSDLSWPGREGCLTYTVYLLSVCVRPGMGWLTSWLMRNSCGISIVVCRT